MKPGIPARFAARALPLLVSAVLVAGFMLVLSSAQSNTTGAPAPLAPAARTSGQSAPLEITPTPTVERLGPSEFSPLSLDGTPAPNAMAVTGPSAPAFGALTCDDYRQVETSARTILGRGMEMRQALSPYKGKTLFEEYVAKWDYEAGWSTTVTTDTVYGANRTLTELVASADADLQRARDLYAFLIVYAPSQCFTADVSPQKEDLCPTEDPDPVDPNHTGQVLDPVIDWCNFKARLRQSVREAANIRMIFGQQFMVDAMGLHFSGTEFYGGEAAVRGELAQMRAALYQYQMAEKGLAGALDRQLGSGCRVSDFYTQAEWSLLSRAIESEETAQHHIATRLSYLGATDPGSVPKVREVAHQAYRAATIDGYVKLIGMAGLGATAPGEACAVGERPDGALAAEMAANLIQTRAKAREMEEGRNVFGFDATFTPASPYKSSIAMNCDTNPVGDRGLWDAAKCAAEEALRLQKTEVDNTREYDRSQEKLRTEADEIRKELDGGVEGASGIAAPTSGGDAATQKWYKEVATQVARLRECKKLVSQNPFDEQGQIVNDTFDACIKSTTAPIVQKGTALQALRDLRGVYMGYHDILTKATNINKRVQYSDDRSATVTGWLIASGVAQTVSSVSQTALSTMSCMDMTSAAKSAICSVYGGLAAATQTAAGAVSTAANVEIDNASHVQETKNLLLDMSELLIEAYAADQQFQAKALEFDGALDSIEGGVQETARARQYFQHSPANDPSFRMVRDSSRMQLAKQMEKASRLAYLTARRAEYEYAARLSASNFRISDIYRSRTAEDILLYLRQLADLTTFFSGGHTYDTNPLELRFSVAKYLTSD